MTFLACLGALWIVLTVVFAIRYMLVERPKNRENSRIATRQRMLDETVVRNQSVAATTEEFAPAGAYERAMQEQLRYAIQCNEWNRIVTSTPPVRFQPVNYPETRQ